MAKMILNNVGNVFFSKCTCTRGFKDGEAIANAKPLNWGMEGGNAPTTQTFVLYDDEDLKPLKNIAATFYGGTGWSTRSSLYTANHLYKRLDTATLATTTTRVHAQAVLNNKDLSLSGSSVLSVNTPHLALSTEDIKIETGEEYTCDPTKILPWTRNTANTLNLTATEYHYRENKNGVFTDMEISNTYKNNTTNSLEVKSIILCIASFSFTTGSTTYMSASDVTSGWKPLTASLSSSVYYILNPVTNGISGYVMLGICNLDTPFVMEPSKSYKFTVMAKPEFCKDIKSLEQLVEFKEV